MPEKAAEPVNGGDGYDLEFVFNKKLEGTTCTYDDLIFMPGTLRDDECDDASMIDFRGESRWCHFVVTEHSVLFLLCRQCHFVVTGFHSTNSADRP